MVAQLQTCYTPQSVLIQVDGNLNRSSDPDGSIASLVLVRIAKQLISLDNELRTLAQDESSQAPRVDTRVLAQVVDSLTQGKDTNIDALVEGTKAFAVITRILDSDLSESTNGLVDFWQGISARLASRLEEHHLSGLKWSFDIFKHVGSFASSLSITNI